MPSSPLPDLWPLGKYEDFALLHNIFLMPYVSVGAARENTTKVRADETRNQVLSRSSSGQMEQVNIECIQYACTQIDRI